MVLYSDPFCQLVHPSRRCECHGNSYTSGLLQSLWLKVLASLRHPKGCLLLPPSLSLSHQLSWQLTNAGDTEVEPFSSRWDSSMGLCSRSLYKSSQGRSLAMTTSTLSPFPFLSCFSRPLTLPPPRIIGFGRLFQAPLLGDPTPDKYPLHRSSV